MTKVGVEVAIVVLVVDPTPEVVTGTLATVTRLGVCPSANEMVPPALSGRLATAAKLVGAYRSPDTVPVQAHTLGCPRAVRVAGPGQPLQRTSPSLVSVPAHWTRPRSCWSEWPLTGQLGPNSGSVHPARYVVVSVLTLCLVSVVCVHL